MQILCELAETHREVFVVVVQEKGGRERRERFKLEEVVIGRVQGNDLVLPKGNVSKRHAAISFDGARWSVTDQGSTNGTYVNRRRIAQTTEVRPGDRIYVGDFVLRVETANEENEVASSRSESIYSTHDSEIASSDLDRPTGIPASPDEMRSSLNSEQIPRLSDEDYEILKALMARLDERLELPEIGKEASEASARRIEQAVSNEVEAMATAGLLSQGEQSERINEAATAELLRGGPLRAILSSHSGKYLVVSTDGTIAYSDQGVGSLANARISSSLEVARALANLAGRSAPPNQDSWLLSGVEINEDWKLYAALERVAPGVNGWILVGAAWFERIQAFDSTLDDYIARGALSRPMQQLLQHLGEAGINMLIVSPNDRESLEFSCALASAVGALPRILVTHGRVEAKVLPNLQVIQHGQFYQGEYQQKLWSQAPVGFIIDGMNGRAAVACCEAIASGAKNLLATSSAHTIEIGVQRIAGTVASISGMTVLDAKHWIHSSFELAIEVARFADGRLRVVRIAELAGSEPKDCFRFRTERVRPDGTVDGQFENAGLGTSVLSSIVQRLAWSDSQTTSNN